MATPKKKGFIAEFRDFATRGNVLDMAVGVVIATAFGKITSTLVNNVFMPVFGYLFGGMDFSQFNIILKPAVMENGKEVVAAVVVGIGALIAAVVDFLLIALAIFIFVKLINGAKEKALARFKQEEATKEAAAPPAPSKEELLLTEIRDLLKDRA